MPRLSSADKKLCNQALDELAKIKTLGFEWETKWLPLHGGNTSQLGGLKGCSRKDSFAAPKPYHVGLAKGSFRSLQLPPLVEVAFANDKPSTADVVNALRAAVKNS